MMERPLTPEDMPDYAPRRYYRGRLARYDEIEAYADDERLERQEEEHEAKTRD